MQMTLNLAKITTAVASLLPFENWWANFGYLGLSASVWKNHVGAIVYDEPQSYFWWYSCALTWAMFMVKRKVIHCEMGLGLWGNIGICTSKLGLCWFWRTNLVLSLCIQRFTSTDISAAPFAVLPQFLYHSSLLWRLTVRTFASLAEMQVLQPSFEQYLLTSS
jgi:hypothetical protein